MGTPYLSEIRLFSFNYAPKGWALCNGQLLAINTNQPLFSLIGTYYGGDGIRTFGLPNLQGSAAIGVGNGPGGTYSLGQTGGEYQHTLLTGEMPQHNHMLNVNNSTSGPQATPSTTTVLGVGSIPTGGTLSIYGGGGAAGALASQTVGLQGSSQAHPNMMPSLALNYCIALQGIYPSQN